ncbi:MAG: tRNA pseudouridine(55) synthase TruB [Planctomycetes bacterium]|nr:tRNA pseudouridine(55) synthase TruB [Planctomycetota bacterium]
MGRKSDVADRNGLINVHKPVGITSRRVVDLFSRWAGTKRVGHAGTLDPLASGVLVVCVGWATRLVEHVQSRSKRYEARFLLGRRSNTDDITGDVIEVADARVPQLEEIASCLPKFVGTILQTPPQFSAVHVAGQRAYAAARRGEVVEIAPRPVVIQRVDLREFHWPELALEIECGSGTYIRSIGRDLGELLGCGAVMSALVRSGVGEFTLETAVSLDDLQATPFAQSTALLPPLQAVGHLPQVQVSGAECHALLQGKWIDAREVDWAEGTTVAILTPGGELFALAEFAADSQCLRPRQVFGAVWRDDLETQGLA